MGQSAAYNVRIIGVQTDASNVTLISPSLPIVLGDIAPGGSSGLNTYVFKVPGIGGYYYNASLQLIYSDSSGATQHADVWFPF